MPILVRPKPFLPRRCLRGIYAGLARLSAGCPPDKGRLHTCYSPVRHSPAGGASSSPAAVRLACVKPAASVHPEPGSNSPLLVIYCYISFLCLFVLTYGSCFLYIIYSLGILTGNSFLCSLVSFSIIRTQFRCRCLSCGISVNVLFLHPGVTLCRFPFCGCKVTAVFARVQILLKHFFIFLFLLGLTR